MTKKKKRRTKLEAISGPHPTLFHGKPEDYARVVAHFDRKRREEKKK